MIMLRALGLMSGTSLDGVDVALIETDGERVYRFGPTGYRPYAEQERTLLRKGLAEAVSLRDRAARPAILGAAEELVTRAHGEAVEAFFARHGMTANDVDIVGFHGQTVLHRPAERLTVQIGDGPTLAKRLHLPVAYDFRAADVAAGGQGAPLVPAYHRALAQDRPALPVVIANIGGVANVTFVGEGDTLMAFDTGPGSALIDDWVRQHGAGEHDEDGRIARPGLLDAARLERLMGDPFFRQPPPKSLDRNHFSLGSVKGLSLADGANTLTRFTATSLARAAQSFPAEPKEWIVSGGGRCNAYLMELLRSAIRQPVRLAEEAGLDGDMIEAQAFAFLAVRTLRRLPITFPGTTGVPVPMPGGVSA